MEGNRSFLHPHAAGAFGGFPAVEAFLHRIRWGWFRGRLRPQRFEAVAVLFEETGELFYRRQGDEVAGDEELLVDAAGGVFHGGVVLVGAEDDPDGRVVAGRDGVGFPPVEVEVHLAGVAVLEGADFQVEQDVAAEEAVVEDEVHVVVPVADGDAFLPGLEAEAHAEFEQEGLEMVEEGGLEVVLGVGGAFGQAGKFEHVGIAEQVGDVGRTVLLLGAAQDGGLVLERPVRSKRSEPI